MPKSDDVIKTEGTIIDILPNQTFKVELENKHVIMCYTGGKMRQFRIRLVMGDKVKVEMSPYDLQKGRITFRLQVDIAIKILYYNSMIETKLTFTYVTPLQGRRKTYTLRTVGQTKKASKEKVMQMFMKEKGPLGMKDRMGCIESIQFRKVKDCWDLV